MLKIIWKTGVLVFAAMLFILNTLAVVSPVMATGPPVWEGDAYSSGAEVTSSILHAGQQYRIVVNGTWWYNWPLNPAADAQYYTTDPSNSWFWGNYFPAPGGASFLQINGQNVSWGSYSPGGEYPNGTKFGHTYTIYFTGTEAAITFKIVDWIDGNYTNNVCHIHIIIYTEITVGGRIADSTPWETAAYFVAGGLIFAAAISIPIINYHRKTQRQKE
jgi:hypothetical protein